LWILEKGDDEIHKSGLAKPMVEPNELGLGLTDDDDKEDEEDNDERRGFICGFCFGLIGKGIAIGSLFLVEEEEEDEDEEEEDEEEDEGEEEGLNFTSFSFAIY